MAALAIENTWIWGLQAGRGAELTAFWRGLADWLDGGARAPFATSVDPARAAPGAIVSVEVAQLDAPPDSPPGNAPPATPRARPASFTLTRPDGAAEPLPLAWQGPVGHARFVPDVAGAFRVGATALGEGTPPLEAPPGSGAASTSELAGADPDRLASPAALAADPAATAPPDAWARLTLLANATGGEALPADALDETLRALGQPRSAWPPPPLVWPLAALALALVEWTARRLRGLA
jgi:hypothetical protein